ncbi:endonuclease/exonuclease/phosphatase family protein [Puniceicoccales bacterium CK1056]|uniref:Endonuclease/exonuclease/phosphatase family protein n=1 Tax=Oceanipulchritudo coccoides TaxID=2706888 RepID=A0A6B2M628_9BACT|nr:endonuclease/exonuclease/phosphatase family protein [Oceanipulchritudo coccoides]NDV63564.1 endonuclease/exonuclease/phosphatase family protein [Oceanipulchritudo coccoides]
MVRSICLLGLVLSSFHANRLEAILVDGASADWPVDAPSVSDPAGDGQSSSADFRKLSVTNDAYNLYLLVEFENPVNLRFADLRLYIDADNNPSTGTTYSGRGMDFSWDFDLNRGTSTLTDRGDIGRGNFIERLAPEGSSTIHEIAVSLEALPAARSGEPVHIALIEENSLDRIPDIGSSLAYNFSGPLSVQPMPIVTQKSRRSVRIVSWNVLRDAPFEGNNLEPFRRVLFAINPDIAILQEIYDTPTNTVLEFFQKNMQIPIGEEWSITRNNDCITVSRYPTEGSWSVDGNLVSRHATEDVLGYRLLIANAHLPCCNSGEDGRIEESANILNLIEVRLNDPTPAPQSIIIGGDLNSGGLAPELIDLTTTIVPLEMASPRHVYQYDQYSWGSDGLSRFGSSKLDFFLFDPATVFRQKAYTLDTDLLPQSALTAMGLQANDTFVSDHLPLVLDLSSRHLPSALQATPMLANGDCLSSWWGKLNGFIYPVVLHERLGWLRLHETAEGFWYADEDGSWFWTGPEIYPWFYSVTGEEWQYDHLHRNNSK